MFKRKSTPPTISPLAPPTSNQYPDRRLSQQQSQHRMGSPQGLAPPGTGSGPGPGSGTAYNSGTPVGRTGSYDSSTIKSEKSEKRRSGFFGFGKKDKDKERDRDEVSELNDRVLFGSVGRGMSYLNTRGAMISLRHLIECVWENRGP